MKLRNRKNSYSHQYYNPKYVGSYAGLNSFSLPNVSKNKIKHYLSTQDTYTLHKPAIRRFKRRKVICIGKFVTLEADLVDIKKLSRHNGGVKYLLTAICCFSKFGFARPLKNKRTSTTIEALRDILRHTKNTKFVCTDNGGEFYSKKMKEFLDTKNITLYSSFNKEIKSSIVERWNRTIQSRLYKYMYANKTKKYTHILQDIVDSYNSTVHSAIGLAPRYVNNKNSERIWHKLYPYEERKRPKFYIGDLVRVQKKRAIFSKGYTPNWTEDVYTVSGIENTTPHTYTLLNANGNKIRKRYYEREMTRTRYIKG